MPDEDGRAGAAAGGVLEDARVQTFGPAAGGAVELGPGKEAAGTAEGATPDPEKDRAGDPVGVGTESTDAGVDGRPRTGMEARRLDGESEPTELGGVTCLTLLPPAAPEEGRAGGPPASSESGVPTDASLITGKKKEEDDQVGEHSVGRVGGLSQCKPATLVCGEIMKRYI